MIEEIAALLIRLVVEACLKVHILDLALCQIYLLDLSFTDGKKAFESTVGLQVATIDLLHHERGLSLTHLVSPKVIAVLKASLIIERITTGRKDEVAKI